MTESTSAFKCRTISTGCLKNLLTRKMKLQLWNVQRASEYRTDLNIPGSEWVPARAINRSFVERRVRDKAEPLVVYSCDRACSQPREAAKALRGLGCSLVFVYRGGIKEWGKAGLPLVSGRFLLLERSKEQTAATV